jgi:hypothetical protein
MIDRDLALLYGVTTKALNQAVKRNIERFPDGFMFRLNAVERKELVTNCDRFKTLRHSKVFPLAFTDYGVAMLSSVLRSPRAIRVNIEIIRAFVRFRKEASSRSDIARAIAALERRVAGHDARIKEIFEAIRTMITMPNPPRQKIGFLPSRTGHKL